MSRLLAPVVGIVVGAASLGTLFCVYHHNRLSKLVAKAHSKIGKLSREKPKNFPEKYASAQVEKGGAGAEGGAADVAAPAVFNDVFEKAVPTASLPRDVPRPELLTAYVRRGFSGFADLPQGRLFRIKHRNRAAEGEAMTPEEISRLSFQIGDRLLGRYWVSRREDGSANSPSVIELAFEMQDISAAGAMIFRILPEGRDTTVFTSETVMWSPSDPSASKLPLTWAVIRYLHEVTAMYLLHSSVTGLIRDGARDDRKR